MSAAPLCSSLYIPAATSMQEVDAMAKTPLSETRAPGFISDKAYGGNTIATVIRSMFKDTQTLFSI